MTLDARLQEWWTRLTDDQRATLKQAAQNDRMEPSTQQLLLGSRCPGLPIIDGQWGESVRTFIAAQ
jgi:hypothetical protein